MRVERVALRDFRSYERTSIAFGAGLTVVHGPNGCGKTNLLEGLYFGCTARSFRTTDDRRLVRRGAPSLRVVVTGLDADGPHELAVGFAPGAPKRMTSDGAPVERLADVDHRPRIAVFSPDRLALVKGPPAVRRGHLDQLIAALWPSRAAARRDYREALAQRNALLGRIRAGAAAADLAAWNAALAAAAVRLTADRRAAVALIEEPFSRHAAQLGLSGRAALRYRSRSPAQAAPDFVAELEQSLDLDLARGHTTRGPHRDELELARDGRALRLYGSQGEQRVAVLALLLAERDVLANERSRTPLLLFDDVMSELDGGRRAHLSDELRRLGQALVTATEPEHVPGWDLPDVALVGLR